MATIEENKAIYLTFLIDKEVFAAHVSKIERIIEVPVITKIPHSPTYMKGVMDLQGNAMPVVDTRLKFEMSPTEMTANTCVLVLDLNIDGELVQLGALVDAVNEVIEIRDDEVRPLPTVGNKYRTEFIQGVVKFGKTFIMLLNMDLLFSADELDTLTDQIDELEKVA